MSNGDKRSPQSLKLLVESIGIKEPCTHPDGVAVTARGVSCCGTTRIHRCQSGLS